MGNARRPIRPLTDREEARIQRGIAADPDNPELTDEELSAMRPAAEMLSSELFAALTKRRPGQRGPGKRPPKIQVTLRLDPVALEAWRATGPGWQARLNEIVVREAPRRGKKRA